jgi:hypothetical protein
MTKRKTLVPFSGGVDSTYILWKLLLETDDEVTAMYLGEEHYNGDIYADKSPIQYQRSLVLVEELRKIRDFKYFKYNVKNSDISEEIQNKALIIIQYAAPFINDGTYDRIAAGGSYEDKFNKVLDDRDFSPMYYAAHNLFNKLCTRGEYWEPLVHGDWHPRYNRTHAFLDLPKHILDLTTACSAPKIDKETYEFVECGLCYKCNMTRKYNELLSQGLTPDEITDWKIKKCYEYGPGKYMISASKWIYLETGIGGPPGLSKESILEDFEKNGHFNVLRMPSTGIREGIIKPKSV